MKNCFPQKPGALLTAARTAMPVLMLTLVLFAIGCASAASASGSPIEGDKVSGIGLVGKLKWLDKNAKSGNTYIINLGLSTNITTYRFDYKGLENVTIVLTGGGKNRKISISSNGSLFEVFPGVTLVLDNITLTGHAKNLSPLVYVNGGTFIMNPESSITRNTTSNNGGGVYVMSGTFTMNGGAITGNSANGSGGGVYVFDGTFNMNDGTVTGNTALISGGDVFIRGNSAFNKTGGAISDIYSEPVR